MTKRIPASIQKIMDEKEDEWNQYEEDVAPIREIAEKQGRADALSGKKQKRRTPKKYADFDFAYMSAYFLGYSGVMCSSEAPKIVSK